MSRAGLLAGLISVCGCTTAGSVVLPPAPKVADALATACSTTDYARPYVVDWAGVDRADLREVEQSGVIVVKHDCDVLRVLTDCKLSGHYGFVGMTREESLVELETAADVRANLPFSGVDLSAQLTQDSSLVLAFAHAGKAVAQLGERPQLTGACSGATHYVRGIYQGAFAMETSQRGAARTAAEVLAASAEASAGGQHHMRVTAGVPASCELARPDSSAPPAGCDIPVRLELRLLSELHANEASPEEATDFVGCPDGFVEVEGRCHVRTSELAYACTPSDLAECARECERGNAVSCARQAYLLQLTEQPSDAMYRAARQLYERACAAGVQHGCSGLGVFYRRGLGGLTADPKRAFDLQNAACRAGEMRGCSSLGVFFDDGVVVAANADEAFKLYDRACQSGLAVACSNLGTLHRDGRGTPPSDANAVSYFERACLSRSPAGCDNLRDLALAGRASGPCVERLMAVYDDDCQHGIRAACSSLERLRANQVGNPQAVAPPAQ